MSIKIYSLVIIALGAFFPIHASRHALIIGANDGGESVERLQYAEEDAKRFSSLLRNLAGFEPANIQTLIAPESSSLDQSLLSLTERLGSDRKESLVLIYYSGHSDNEALMLGSTRYPLKRFRERFEKIPSQIRVGVIDACQSGMIARFKGGKLARPFYLESQKNVEGQIIIASSAADEKSQESDDFRGSIFTHHWMNGLRGSADISGDKKVTINEAYQYAYAKTIETTALSRAGVQHPTYQFRILGEGDVALTDLSNQKSGLLFGSGLQGRYIILNDDYSGILADFYKKRTDIFVSLSPGKYRVVRSSANPTFAIASLEQDRVLEVADADFNQILPQTYGIKGEFSVDEKSMHKEKELLELLGTNLNHFSKESRTKRKMWGGILAVGGGAAMVISGSMFATGDDGATLPAIGLGLGGAFSAGLGIWALKKGKSADEAVYETFKAKPDTTISDVRTKSFYGETHFQEKAQTARFNRYVGILKAPFSLTTVSNIYKTDVENRFDNYTEEKIRVMQVNPSQREKRPDQEKPNNDPFEKFGLQSRIDVTLNISGFGISYNFNPNNQMQLGALAENFSKSDQSLFLIYRHQFDSNFFAETGIAISDDLGIPFYAGYEWGDKKGIEISVFAGGGLQESGIFPGLGIVLHFYLSDLK